jgi:hypothetical protein
MYTRSFCEDLWEFFSIYFNHCKIFLILHHYGSHYGHGNEITNQVAGGNIEGTDGFDNIFMLNEELIWLLTVSF